MAMAMAVLLTYERFHYRHDTCWLLSGRESEDSAVCLACVIEIVEDEAVAVVRKKHVLSTFQMVLKNSSSIVIELLTSDGRVCTHFIETLLGMLLSIEDGPVLDLVTDILVQLMVELKLEHLFHCVLDECHKQLLETSSIIAILPVFSFLGKLVNAMPHLADMFSTEHCNLVECMPRGLMYPNESIKSAVCYLYGKLYSSPAAAEKLSNHFIENLCGPFLATLESALTKELQINCMGLLKQLLNSEHFVSVIMSESGYQGDSESTPTLQALNPLPLVLKKVLLCKEELLQIASTQCITAILVHSTRKYAPSFILADIPEFLFEHLSSTSEVLIWSIYCCLLLMTEERLFFSKCHTVYGIDALLRSIKDVLKMNNVELHKQGLLLLTEILERQPKEIKLFTNPGIFTFATDVLLEAVNCQVLEVAVQAIKCASGFLRKDHLTTPVQYGELQKLVTEILKRCADNPFPAMIRRRVNQFLFEIQIHPTNRDQVRHLARQGHLLTSTLQAFQSACRIALDCQSDPCAQENAFTAPTSESEDTLEKFSFFLLEICDTICIPTVTKYYERAPVASVMEIYFSVLCSMFAVVPSMKESFAIKLGSASFIRLVLEVKMALCSGQSYKELEISKEKINIIVWYGIMTEVSDVLQKSLIHLTGSVSESLSLLLEAPSDHNSLMHQQHSLLVIFCVAYVMEDRFIPEADLFCTVLGFLHCTQSRAGHIPLYVIRAAFYLLAVCQEKSEDLSTVKSHVINPSLCFIWGLIVSVNLLCTILKSVPDIQLLYFHHPLFLKFFFRYPQLIENYGGKIIKLWITYKGSNDDGRSSGDCSVSLLTNNECTFLPLQSILQSNPNSVKVFLFDCKWKGKLRQIFLMLAVSSLSGKCNPCSMSVLQPAFNFLYCSLHQSSSSCRMRATAMLLSSISLIELIQKILELAWEDSQGDLSETICCSANLITSSLVSFQHIYNLEVHRSFDMDIDKMLHLISFNSKKKSSMLIVSRIQLLKILLKQKFTSALLKIKHSESSNWSRTERESALYPLNVKSILYLLAALQNLLIQKDFLLVRAAINCIETLLDFLHARDLNLAHHVASQPWNRFVLLTSLELETGFLQPGILRFMTLFLKYESANIITASEIKKIIEEASKLTLSELTATAIVDLKIFLQQVSC
ncbi:meiosis inhibitor protein 1 [Spea bombifrons]|uniref:meiosis inhibitor protein 1 n=1 Tax=Spea bombifrons TaxID=233779 RepID=UPI00234B25B2|nr:meiosis inhibitor protein 1 [Spea bombifrons]